MEIPSLARNERASRFPHFLKAAGTSLVAIVVALLAASCGGGDYGRTAGSGASTKCSGGRRQ